MEKPCSYLQCFTGLIDASAALYFFVPHLRTELLLLVFKFGRILWVFKLIKFIGEVRTIGVFLFSVFLLQLVFDHSELVMELVATGEARSTDVQ